MSNKLGGSHDNLFKKTGGYNGYDYKRYFV